MNLLYILIICFIIIVVNINIIVENFSYPIQGKKYLNRISIWENVRKKYGFKTASQIFPVTYLLPRDINNIKNNNQKYILKKKWGEQRNGLLLCNNSKEVLQNYKKYDIAQEFIRNPVLENGFKVDIRIFMVTHCNYGNFIYNEGYLYFTNKRFNYNSQDPEKKINMTKPPENHYKQNNLSKLFSSFCNKHSYNKSLILKKVSNQLRYIINSTKSLCNFNDKDKYHIYGIDIELVDNLKPIIIEINSNPSLKFNKIKWKRDFINKMLNDIKNNNFYNSNWITVNTY